jgi:hypothetical protein
MEPRPCFVNIKTLLYSEIDCPKIWAISVIKKAKGNIHRNLRTRRRMFSQPWMISLVKQGKFKVGVVPADRLGC